MTSVLCKSTVKHLSETTGLAEPTAGAELDLLARVRRRRDELETTVSECVARVASEGIGDAEYDSAVRQTISIVIDYALVRLEGDDGLQPVPSVAIGQARRAARHGVSLDTVLRRYVAGHRVLGEYLHTELTRTTFHTGIIAQRFETTRMATLEDLQATIACEYKREQTRLANSADGYLHETVQRLLAGEIAEAHDLDYQFDAWHTAFVACGRYADRAVRQIADAAGSELLSVGMGGNIWWAWLSGEGRIDHNKVSLVCAKSWASAVSLAIGEPRHDIVGWRTTHREAQAARLVAKHRGQAVTYCADVPMEVAILQHEIASRVLRERFLAPIKALRTHHGALKTLRCYLDHDCQVSSAETTLGITRKTAAGHLRAIEAVIGRPISSCLAELDIALRLDEFGYPH